MEISDFVLRLVGSASLPEKLEVGEDLTLGLNVNIYAAETKNNEDGTCTETFKAKPTGEILINKKWGKAPIHAKSRNSPSVRLRNALFYYHEQQGIAEDFEIWYDKYISEIIAKLE